MGLRVNTNVAAINAHRQLWLTDTRLSRSIEKLSSGYRINRAADDAAGLAVANKLRVDIRAMNVASRNAAQANTMVQVAEGAMGNIAGMLERLKELATQAASDNLSDTERGYLDTERSKIEDEINRISASTNYQGRELINGTFGMGIDTANTTDYLENTAYVQNIEFNGASASATYTFAAGNSSIVITEVSTGDTQKLSLDDSTQETLNFDKMGIKFTHTDAITATSLNGTTLRTSAAADATFQVGSGAGGSMSDNQVTFGFADLSTTGAVLNISGDITSRSNSESYISTIDNAIGSLNTQFASIGAMQNKLGFAIEGLEVAIENISAAESTIRDVDMAAEMTTFTRNQILMQSGTAMLAQANMSTQNILALIGGG
ncbi:MAG: flagellin [Deltaproteobacteria bacterium]|nr:flagellin [Deltaproteobacteria bacterium]